MAARKLRKSAWIRKPGPNAPVTRVAKAALRDRLDLVRHDLTRAAKKPEKNVEYVHRLRVATRRSQAALDIFREALPGKRARKLRKQLKRARRCAGEARDLDVLQQRLANLAASNPSLELDRLIDQVSAQRRRAQRPLVRIHRRLKRRNFKSQVKKLRKRIRWRGEGPEPTFGQAACCAMRNTVDEFFSAALGDLSHPLVLHQVRIAGKRLRYAIELLAAAFDESLRRELYPIFKEVQDRLGNVNDHETARRLFLAWSEQTEPAAAMLLRELASAEQQKIERTSREFCEWWTDKRAFGLRQQFEIYLTDPATNPNTQPSHKAGENLLQATRPNDLVGAERHRNGATGTAFHPHADDVP